VWNAVVRSAGNVLRNVQTLVRYQPQELTVLVWQTKELRGWLIGVLRSMGNGKSHEPRTASRARLRQCANVNGT
jgi:hypothetical protein